MSMFFIFFTRIWRSVSLCLFGWSKINKETDSCWNRCWKISRGTYYINHACKDSNLEVVQFCDASRQLQLDSSGKIIPFRRNLFVTRKKINEGEELTFVYEKKGGRGSTNTFLDGKDCYCTHCCNKRGFDWYVYMKKCSKFRCMLF
jgi:hypothetical protein